MMPPTDPRLAIARVVWPELLDHTAHPLAVSRLTGLVADVLAGRKSDWLTVDEIKAIRKAAAKQEEPE